MVYIGKEREKYKNVSSVINQTICKDIGSYFDITEKREISMSFVFSLPRRLAVGLTILLSKHGENRPKNQNNIGIRAWTKMLLNFHDKPILNTRHQGMCNFSTS